MKRLAFIAILGISSVYFVGCVPWNIWSVEEYSEEDEIRERQILNTIKAERLRIGDYSGTIECKNDEDKIKGCVYWHLDSWGYIRATSYKNGKINGLQTLYHYNGNIDSQSSFKNGVLDGILITYHKNGNLMYEAIYKEGELDGIKKQYYQNGNLELEEQYQEGCPIGIERWYYDNGNPMREIPYNDCRRDGEWREYRKDGALYFSIVYENGEAIRGKCGDDKEIKEEHFPLFDKWVWMSQHPKTFKHWKRKVEFPCD